LGKLARDENAQIALAACGMILSKQVQLGQYAELCDRIEALESRLADENRNSDW
jgi:hypothetical protein